MCTLNLKLYDNEDDDCNDKGNDDGDKDHDDNGGDENYDIKREDIIEDDSVLYTNSSLH